MEKEAEDEEERVDWQRERDDVKNSMAQCSVKALTEANGAPWSPTSTQRRNPDDDDDFIHVGSFIVLHFFTDILRQKDRNSV